VWNGLPLTNSGGFLMSDRLHSGSIAAVALIPLEVQEREPRWQLASRQN
jgi:hypothetical protein